MKGIFISLEGIEGTGKSTQAKLLSKQLGDKGFDVVLTEEPGGTQIGLKIRELLLSVDHTNMTPVTELLLYNASRTQHIGELIFPALERGAIVITDRFTDSTLAYQGYGRGIDLNAIHTLDAVATGNLRPDITILLDLDVDEGLRRNRGIYKTDRLELEDIRFHRKVRSGYLDLADKEPGRIKLVNAARSIDEVQREIAAIITNFIDARHGI